MSALQELLDTFRDNSKTEREKGNYFEKLVKVYLQNEPCYKDLFNGKVYLWEEWRKHWMSLGNSDPQSDAGIDLVAVEDVKDNPRIFAIQAKFYAEDAKIRKSDGIDSFLSALGKQPFTNGMLFLTSYAASHHVNEAIQGRDKPINIVDLFALEASKIDWAVYLKQSAVTYKEPKDLRDYQKKAIRNVVTGLKYADRGKLIMACGTGKTFTSLRLAEDVAGKGGRVLFLVPSLSLLSQTLTEWTQESAMPIHSFAVCSDSEVGKRKDKEDDFEMLVHELQYPATTDSRHLAREIEQRHDNEHMSVVFSTYHSIEVISQAQKQYALSQFDLIICDEAHRTTGASFEGEDESTFVKVHSQEFIKGNKRVYMTATPRVYGVNATAKAEKEGIVLYDMNKEEFFGETLHTLSFSEAVHGLGILCDYKVIVLTISEDHINKNLQRLLADENNSLRVDDAAKIVGCWRALSKQDSQDDLSFDPDPMRRAVAFCQVIEPKKGSKTHKVSSVNIASMFKAVVDEYRTTLIAENPEHPEAISKLTCEAEHVDGGMNASQKEAKLQWLKAESPEDTCRILSNVRCLSEGVDVPALDAVLFLTPRNSQVDVVQSVGRVMRKPKNSSKKLGYVILPVVIPSGMEPEEALNDNKTYKVVWEVLQALRSHDDRFDAMINKLDLTGQDRSKMEIIAVTDNINIKSKQPTDPQEAKVKKAASKAKGSRSIGAGTDAPLEQKEIDFHVGEIEKAIVAKVVQKCGNRLYWDDWAADIARIAQTHISRITAIIDTSSNTSEIKAFNGFLSELKDDLNDSITREEAIEMLAQHIITKPVFDALFEGYSFTQNNPVSKAMQGVLEVLNEHNLEKEAETLEQFYESVRVRAAGIDDLTAKQKIIVELYDKFFRKAFPKMTERLGIVYTPVEVVDFIINSVNDVLQSEFGQSLGSKGVHIIDPFTGTGTFITRLLQSGLISKDELAYKFKNEIHANEIVLLAYYIAAINIEQVYHNIVGGDYVPFDGICLTDTFALYEKDDLVSELMADNSSRRHKQKKLDIRVIVGNPPYSAGQESANDDAANIDYKGLDQRIASTFLARSSGKGGKRSSYDSYIRALRWASDRVGTSGVIGFVTGSGFIDKASSDGLRKCLVDEFSKIYVFNLRGDIRKNILSKGLAKEGQNIFGSGSMTGIAITVMVKSEAIQNSGEVYYYDVGDDISQLDKLKSIQSLKSIAGISNANLWQPVVPDDHGDWIGHRDSSFSKFLLLGSKKKLNESTLFEVFTNGVVTGRDAWVYNYSKQGLIEKCKGMVEFFNSEIQRYSDFSKHSNAVIDVQDFVAKDTTKISWGGGNWQAKFEKMNTEIFEENKISVSLYRPYTKTWHYGAKTFNHSFYSLPKIFPSADSKNLLICLSGVGAQNQFSVLMTNALPNYHTIQTGLCFPLYVYKNTSDIESNANENFSLLPDESSSTKRYALTDEGLREFQLAYPNELLNKEDIFYYVYGLLHSEEYRKKYADNLNKELPRIPCVKQVEDFWQFSKSGKELAELHLNFETVEPYPLEIHYDNGFSGTDYKVTKMKYGKDGADKDLSTLIYNDKIFLTGIPLEAYEYVVNGKPALDWVVERQRIKEDKDSGIINDANLWATETIDDAAYPLKLFQRVITVSLETIKIVRHLPKLEID